MKGFNPIFKNNMAKKLILLVVTIFTTTLLFSQKIEINYSSPQEYEISGINVKGIKYLNTEVLVQLSGLKVGDKIEVPGERFSNSIDKLWRHGLFSDVKILADSARDGKLYITFELLERPRVSNVFVTGLNKTEREDIEEMIELKRGGQATDNLINNTKIQIKKHFAEKAYFNTQVDVSLKNDTNILNAVIAYVHVDKNKKIKVNSLVFEGNEVLSDKKLNKAMKKTNDKNIKNFFRTKKYKEEEFIADKQALIEKYNEKGYRDAKIVYDTVYANDDKSFNINIKIEEGKPYFFRNISWVGNTKYSSYQLSRILNVKKGDPYDENLLNERISSDEDAVSNLYLDDGYLFFQIQPIELKVENDSIDLEMRVYEGRQATIKNVTVSGNTKTNDHVIMREVYSRPGELFKKSDIVRTIRELAQLGHFDPEKLNVNPVPDQANGTVDLDYTVEERANDQIEISGGWGANMIIGTIGLKFNNFAINDVFKKDAWRPVPSGDGQQLSLRVQSNGTRYQSYSLSFTEPWLGGKKANSLSVSLYKTVQSNGYQKDDSRRADMAIAGAALGLGKRLKWPDDYFTIYNELSYQQYNMNEWPYFLMKNGISNNLSYKFVFGRNSVDSPLFPRRGSNISVSLQATPPYSLLRTKTNYSDWEEEEKYKWIEYHKWTFKSEWITKLLATKDLVLYTRYELGFLGYYNKDLRSPFEQYQVGGDGMSGYNMYGSDIVSLRGYENYSLTPAEGGNIYSRFTMELRYPVSLNPQATIYALTFIEAGNAWYNFKDFNPFNLNRSAGVGVRIFLPMLGLLGIDWGYGFDPIPGKANDSGGGQFHFVMGQQF